MRGDSLPDLAFLQVRKILSPCGGRCLSHAPGVGHGNAAQQVSEAVAHGLLVTPDNEGIIIIGIAGQAAVVDQVESHRVDAEAVHGEKRVNDVANRL